MDMIENQTFDEIKPGETASLVRTLSREDIELFAIMSYPRPLFAHSR
jgi:phosphate acetyltransferase